jgi:predicted  nucleic acid-binding Zn-ribbon protein
MVNRINNKKITKKITKKINKKPRKTRKTRKTRKIQKGGVPTQEALDKLKNYKDTCCDKSPMEFPKIAETCRQKLVKGVPEPGLKVAKKMAKKNQQICGIANNESRVAEQFFQKAAAISATIPIQQEENIINENIISTNNINNNMNNNSVNKNVNNDNNNNKFGEFVSGTNNANFNNNFNNNNKNEKNVIQNNKNVNNINNLVNNSNPSKNDLDDTLTAYDATLKELSEHLEKMTNKNNELEALIMKLQNKETTMKEDLEKLKTIMTANQNEILDLQEQVTQKDSQYEKLTADLEQMTSDKEKIELSASEGNLKSGEIIKQLQTDIEKLQEEEQNCSSERDGLIARMKTVQTKLTINQTKFEEEISKLNKLNNQIDEFKTKMSSVVSSIGTPLTNAYSQFNKQAQQVIKNNNNNNGVSKTEQQIALEKFNQLESPTIKSTNNDFTKPTIVDNENTSNVVRNKDLNQRGGERQTLYKMFGGGKKYNLRWRYVSHRTTFGGYNRKSLERLATKWGIQNAKSYKRRDLLQKTMHFIMFARYGDIKKRKNLNIAAKMIGINPRKYKKKQDLYRAVYSKTNKMSFNIRGGKKVTKKTKKTRKN